MATARRRFRQRVLGVLAVLLMVVGIAVAPSPAEGVVKTELQYVVSPHADDEGGAWALVANRASTYTVFVLMTRGEQTRSCMTVAESKTPEEVPPALEPGADRGWEGPHRYQGPNSPVGQPNLGEIHPYGDPWQGKGTEACKEARVASWNGYLDDQGRDDPTLPVAPSYRGEFCVAAATCAKVWAGSLGARVAFEVPDGGLTPEDVTRHLQVLRSKRHAWRIPATLPERRVIASSYFHKDGDGHDCPYSGDYHHPDHKAVDEAIFTMEQGVPERLGATCEDDPRWLEAGGSAQLLNPLYLERTFNVNPVTGERLGHYNRHYGWLFDTWTWGGGNAAGPVQHFWSRAGKAMPPGPPGQVSR